MQVEERGRNRGKNVEITDREGRVEEDGDLKIDREEGVMWIGGTEG